jgi:predicted dinucleotide-binding enzyme
MDIVIIGTGNTATVMGKKLRMAGHRIVQVFGRNSSLASELAYELDTESTNYWNVVNRNADLYIIAVSDIAVEEVFRELQLSDKTVVHTAASVSKEVLKGGAKHYGVLYPLQSLKKDAGYLPEIPMVIDAGDAATLNMLDVLAHTISERVVVADDATRM